MIKTAPDIAEIKNMQSILEYILEKLYGASYNNYTNRYFSITLLDEKPDEVT